MDGYSGNEIYSEDDRLKQIYSEVPKAENYFKTLRIRSLYTSDKDLKQYFRKKYQLGEEELKNHSISYNGREYIYRFENGTTVTYTSEEDEKLKGEHVDEGVYCLPYKCISADIYGSVINELLTDTFTIIDDKLIDKAVELVGRQYSSEFDSEEDSRQGDFENNNFDIDLDYRKWIYFGAF